MVTTTTTRELLYCWVAWQFSVLVPKRRGVGFLKVPYGHHVDAGLLDIETIAGCDIYGLDGALDFQCPGSVYHGGNSARIEFASIVMPELERHYGCTSREIRPAEFFALNPYARHPA